MLEKKIVGKMISLQRKESGLTQKQLADMLHVSYQAVSKWELGLCLPSIEIIYDIAMILDVSVDFLLNGTSIENRDICHKDMGLDVQKLSDIKAKLQAQVTHDKRISFSNFSEPLIFKMDSNNIKNPVYLFSTYVPGSKAKFAKEYSFGKELCIDLVARAINHIIQYGAEPFILQAHITCGDNDSSQILSFGEVIKKTCESNNTIFGGLEISSQPLNYLQKDYELTVSIIGIAEEESLITGAQIQKDDLIIGILSEGLDSTCFPLIKVIAAKNPEILYEKIDDTHSFIEEILKPGAIFLHEMQELKKAGILHGFRRVRNSVLNRRMYEILPDGLGACIELSRLPVTPMCRYLYKKEILGSRFFPSRLPFGIAMLAIVPADKKNAALQIIERNHKCIVIGSIKNNNNNFNQKLWTEDEVRW